jgi:hypothetical protein
MRAKKRRIAQHCLLLAFLLVTVVAIGLLAVWGIFAVLKGAEPAYSLGAVEL